MECQKTSNDLNKGNTEDISFIDSRHPPCLNGMELLADAYQNKFVFSIGWDGIDSLLGGLRGGQLTELVGPSPSGKTQVCLQAASHIAHKYGGTVMFFDTSNSFSSKRVAHLVSLLVRSSNKEVKERIVKSVMSNILCYSVFDIFMLLDLLSKLEVKLRSQVQNKKKDLILRLLVIDSFSSLVAPVLGGKGSPGHFLMVSAGFLLKRIANENNIAVLLTNHMVGGEGGTSKPALGESWKTVPHVRLLLSHDRGSNVHNVSICKHTCMAAGQSARFHLPN